MSNDLLAFSILEALPLSSQNILGKNDCLINFFSCSVQECSWETLSVPIYELLTLGVKFRVLRKSFFKSPETRKSNLYKRFLPFRVMQNYINCEVKRWIWLSPSLKLSCGQNGTSLYTEHNFRKHWNEMWCRRIEKVQESFLKSLFSRNDDVMLDGIRKTPSCQSKSVFSVELGYEGISNLPTAICQYDGNQAGNFFYELWKRSSLV